MSYDFQRFISAQENVYAQALREIQHGAKRSHWMWFVFPQIAGLGHSPTARRYAIGSLAEAKAFLAHPVLGNRLVEITQALLAVESKTADDIFGHPDNLKLKSSMTLWRAIYKMSSSAQ